MPDNLQSELDGMTGVKQRELQFSVLRALERRPLTLSDLRFVVTPEIIPHTTNPFSVKQIVDQLVEAGFVTTATGGIWTHFWPSKEKKVELSEETPLTLTSKAALWMHPPLSISGHYHPLG